MFVRVRVRLDAFEAGMGVRLDVDFAFGNVFEPVGPFANPLPGPAGDLEDRSVGVELAEIAEELVVVEVRVRQQIDLVEHKRADFVEQQRILTGFVVALGDTEDADLGVLAEVEFGRTSDVADVLDQYQVERIEVQFAETALDERRFQMTRPAREQLDHRHAELRDPVAIAGRRDVTFEHAEAELFQCRDCFFEQRSLTGTGSADEVNGGNFFCRELFAVAAGNLIICSENILKNFDVHDLAIILALPVP